MRFAHSLGYPHCDLMLADMTSSQLVELYSFFEMESREHERAELEQEGQNIERFFDLVEVKQKADNG